MWARIYCSVLLVSIAYYLFTLSFHLSNTQFTTNLQTDIFYIASIRDTELKSVIRDTELYSVIRDTELESVIRDTELESVIRDTELESVIRDTELESVIIVTFQNRLSYCKNARYFNNEV